MTAGTADNQMTGETGPCPTRSTWSFCLARCSGLASCDGAAMTSLRPKHSERLRLWVGGRSPSAPRHRWVQDPTSDLVHGPESKLRATK